MCCAGLVPGSSRKPGLISQTITKGHSGPMPRAELLRWNGICVPYGAFNVGCDSLTLHRKGILVHI